ncbi:4'-phosphopantetheinyl transferase family protein [Priestia filamentosa]|uniref:4'-phosphopantetheinyl transferase family protein n=1 Tax=Priestia filamentosa TaxID=1402861 RepID=UPI0002F1BE4D|nr:4'-phosphopantetheinyl transferase superfamily protein [Priestia filamentosa]
MENAKLIIIPLGNRLENTFLRQKLKSLPKYERDKISAYHNWEDRQRSLLAQLYIRKYFTKLLNTTDFLIERTEKGRPYLSSSQLFNGDFNFSHSSDKILCGISTHGKIGVDIEKAHLIDLSITKYCFTQEEILYYKDLRFEERLSFFFKIWTLKEAFVKTTGEGMSVHFFDFGFDMDSWGKGKITLRNQSKISSSTFHFKSLKFHNDFFIGVCSNEIENLNHIELQKIDRFKVF